MDVLQVINEQVAESIEKARFSGHVVLREVEQDDSVPNVFRYPVPRFKSSI